MRSVVVRITVNPDAVGSQITKKGIPLISADQVGSHPYLNGKLEDSVRTDLERVLDVMFEDIFVKIRTELSTMLNFNPSVFRGHMGFTSKFDINVYPVTIVVEVPDCDELYYPGDRYSQNDEIRRKRMDTIAVDIDAPISDYLTSQYQAHLGINVCIVAVNGGES